ncbi:hypothetical protein BDZ91DRAFT_735655, partial [Kalaharituber pfeilii]
MEEDTKIPDWLTQTSIYYWGPQSLSELYKKRKPGSPWNDKWRGLAKITHISTKGKIDFETPDHGQFRGWHTDRIKPFIICDL